MTVVFRSISRRHLVRRSAALVAGVAWVLMLTGCSAGPGGPAAAKVSTPPTLSFSVGEKASDVVPAAVVKVESDGTLHDVQVVSADGEHALEGAWTDDGVWSSSGPLRLDTTYQAMATATSADGLSVTRSRTFSTVKPRVDATYWVTPDDATVGVGMPVVVTFDTPVETTEQRAAIEQRMTITTVPRTEGSWGWVDSRQLMWRPKTYWRAGTTVAVEAPLAGLQTGSGKWVRENKSAAFRVADRARVLRVDLDDHFVRVVDDGKITAEYPVSAGQAKGSWETRSGTKVITEKHEKYTMDAGTLGVPEGHADYYKKDVTHAMRVTNTGEFFHAAPWSVSSQGRRNVSHGCVNMSPADAETLFRGTMVGDPVEFVDSRRQMKPEDGLPVWLFTYAEWRELSELPSTPTGL